MFIVIKIAPFASIRILHLVLSVPAYLPSASTMHIRLYTPYVYILEQGSHVWPKRLSKFTRNALELYMFAFGKKNISSDVFLLFPSSYSLFTYQMVRRETHTRTHTSETSVIVFEDPRMVLIVQNLCTGNFHDHLLLSLNLKQGGKISAYSRGGRQICIDKLTGICIDMTAYHVLVYWFGDCSILMRFSSWWSGLRLLVRLWDCSFISGIFN